MSVIIGIFVLVMLQDSPHIIHCISFTKFCSKESLMQFTIFINIFHCLTAAHGSA